MITGYVEIGWDHGYIYSGMKLSNNFYGSFGGCDFVNMIVFGYFINKMSCIFGLLGNNRYALIIITSFTAVDHKGWNRWLEGGGSWWW